MLFKYFEYMILDSTTLSYNKMFSWLFGKKEEEKKGDKDNSAKIDAGDVTVVLSVDVDV